MWRFKGRREPKYRASGILCAVLRRFPSPWQGFAYGDTGRQPPGWHSAGRWERRKRRGRSGKNWETQKTDLIFEIVRELNGQVAGEQNDATSFIKPLGERDETRGIEAVF